MKILMINVNSGRGSTGRICTDIADVLMAQGHCCRIAYGRDDVPEKYRDISVRIGSDAGVLRNAARSRLFDNEGFNAGRATKKLLAWIAEYNPDVIHLHNLHGYYLNVRMLFDYLRASRKKVIWTLHDCWSFTGHCSYFSYCGCEKWRTGCSHCPQHGSYPASLFLDRSRRNWSRKRSLFTGLQDMTIVTPSEWLATLVRESFLGEYPVKVIHNGIDLEVFRPTESNFREVWQLTGKRVILGVAALWDARKGFDDFLKLSRLLDDGSRMVLVGVSPKQKAALPGNIIGITRTNHVKELAEIYTAADVMFNPTYEDNYPTVNLEAQACGTPVVTYATGGSVESVPEENVIGQGDYAAFLRCQYSSRRVVSLDRQDMIAEYVNLLKNGITVDK